MSFVHMGGWLGRNGLLSTTLAIAITAAIAAAQPTAIATATAFASPTAIASQSTGVAAGHGVPRGRNAARDVLLLCQLRARGRRGPRAHHVRMARAGVQLWRPLVYVLQTKRQRPFAPVSIRRL